MKSASRAELDHAVYWPLHALVAAVLFGVLVGPFFGSGSPVPARVAIELIGGVALYYFLFFQFSSWQQKAPRLGPTAFFVLQWGIVFGLMLLVPGNFTWLLALPVVAQSARCRRAVLVSVYIIFLGTMTWVVKSGGTWETAISSMFSIGASFAFVMVFTLATCRAVEAQRTSEELARQLGVANAQLRAVSEQSAALAAANERNRIARDIHDGLGHALTVIAVQLQIAKTLNETHDTTRAGEAIARAEELSRGALDEVRASVGALRAAPSVALPAALAGLVQQSGATTSLQVTGQCRVLPDEAEQALFRAVQEGLTNVRKHASASRVKVILDYINEANVAVSVLDDGRGQKSAGSHGFGLRGIGERVGRLGGKIRAHNSPAGGFELRIEIPV